MKKRVFCFLLAVMLIVCVMPMAALADGEASVTNASGKKGETIKVPITVTSPSYGFAFKASVSVPDSGLTLNDITISSATMADDVNVDDDVTGAFYTINGKNITFVTDTGSSYVVTLNLTADAVGEYNVGIDISEMLDFEEKAVISAPLSASGTVTVEEGPAYLLGDVNGDGSVNRADRNYLIKALAGWDGYPITNKDAADVNKDGTVNRADRNYLIKALAGWAGYTL